LIEVCLPEGTSICVIIEDMKIKSQFFAAHAVTLPLGKEEMHSHNWQVLAEFSGINDSLPATEDIVSEETAKLENLVLNELEPLKPFHASAESVAKYLFDTIAEKLTDLDVKIIRLEVEEEPGYRAAYRVE
jgi:6-pyruvoyl-tetrahydropterin synthase